MFSFHLNSPCTVRYATHIHIQPMFASCSIAHGTSICCRADAGHTTTILLLTVAYPPTPMPPPPSPPPFPTNPPPRKFWTEHISHSSWLPDACPGSIISSLDSTLRDVPCRSCCSIPFYGAKHFFPFSALLHWICVLAASPPPPHPPPPPAPSPFPPSPPPCE